MNLVFYSFFVLQDEKNQLMTTNVWLWQVNTSSTAYKL